MATAGRYGSPTLNGDELAPEPVKSSTRGDWLADGACGRYLLILPVSLVLLVFFFFPLGVIFLYSFSSTDSLAHLSLTVANYTGVLGNPTKLGMYVNSIIYSSATVAGCFVLGFPVAYFIAKHLSRMRQAYVIALLVAPLFMSKLIRILGWRMFFLKYGLFNELLAYVGLPRVGGLTYLGPMAIFGMVYLYFPFMLFPIYVAISNISDEVLHAARDLGGGSLRVMRRIVLPLAAPGIAVGSALVFALSFGSAISSEVLVGNNIQLVGNMEKFSFGYAQNWLIGSAEATIMMIFLLVVIVPILRRADIGRLLYGMGSK